MDTLKLKIVTPERVFYEDDVDMVEFNTTEGQMGVYARHVPTTVIIAPGVLSIKKDGEIKKAALHSGFIEILPESVTMLAETVEWPEEIDEKRAESAMERAKKRLSGELDKDKTDMARANTALMRAVTRISVIK